MPETSRVHIVDDDASVRDALAMLLATAGIESRAYASAEAFLDCGPVAEATCVLLDIQLPGMSGVELLRLMTARASRAAVIMITAYPDVPTAVATMRMGAFHFVQKPFDAEALLLTIEEGIARSAEANDQQRDTREIAARFARLTPREAGSLRAALRGAADQDRREPARDHQPNRRTSPRRGHAEDGGAHDVASRSDGAEDRVGRRPALSPAEAAPASAGASPQTATTPASATPAAAIPAMAR